LPVSGSPHGQLPWPPSKLARLRKPFQGPDNSDSPTAPTAPTLGESYGLWRHVTNKHPADTPVSDSISSFSIVVKLWTNQEFGIKLYQRNSMCNLSNSSVSNFVVPLQCRSRLLTVQESVKRLRSGLGILENRTTCDLWQTGVLSDIAYESKAPGTSFMVKSGHQRQKDVKQTFKPPPWRSCQQVQPLPNPDGTVRSLHRWA
jgi:hypothetical protein